jgi:AraC-like DNA-binding protein
MNRATKLDVGGSSGREPQATAPHASSLRRATDIVDFVRAPSGACLADRQWVYFRPDPAFSGYVVWGRPEASDFAALARVLPGGEATSMPPHPMLIDVRELDLLPAATFDAAVRHTKENFDELSRTVTRLAIVRPEGVTDAIAAGFFEVARAFAPVRLFAQPAEALAWLDRSGWAWLLDDVEGVRRTGGLAQLVDSLQGLLDADPMLPIEEAAHRLALSPRTLRRRLRELGTSITLESARARVRVAENLLIETDASMTEIAFRVGCSSAQHFSTLFRSVNGEPPSSWRLARR